MATTYTKPKPDADVYGFLNKAIRKWHPELVQAEVTVGVLAAWPSEGDEHALKLHGYPCAAIIKITPYKQRVQGIEDAVITIDGPTWKDLGDAERLALIDHELVHLEVARDEDGQIKSDDCGRPKLKARLHDWELGGFRVIAERHGAAALESQMFREAHRTYYQAVFSWADDQGPQDEASVIDLVGGREDGGPAGVKEAEAQPVAPPWRSVVIGDLGLAESTVEALDEHVIPTVGELVTLMAASSPPEWLDDAALLDIDAGLGRFRNRRSNAEIEDFDAAMGAEAEKRKPKSKPGRARKASA